MLLLLQLHRTLCGLQSWPDIIQWDGSLKEKGQATSHRSLEHLHQLQLMPEITSTDKDRNDLQPAQVQSPRVVTLVTVLSCCALLWFQYFRLKPMNHMIHHFHQKLKSTLWLFGNDTRLCVYSAVKASEWRCLISGLCYLLPCLISKLQIYSTINTRVWVNERQIALLNSLSVRGKDRIRTHEFSGPQRKALYGDSFCRPRAGGCIITSLD